ncbi:hypothetical protein NM208_g2772 [Fusarium decemcellulare]|uniref:Uncharacterized protein n=1 Tax=Fusarium decemcellulare TaxID=57161 RepID=A0ACC1SRI2_9HYPO|nr:hypothetical protein NM208_g2772 [Fusarium decemcellulare]
MTTSRYGLEGVDPEPLARPLHFYPSGRIAKNRFLKGPMSENFASWSPYIPLERGIPTDETVSLYKRWGEGTNNFGVIVTGSIDIDVESMSEPGAMAIPLEAGFNGERFDRFKALAEGAKVDGSLILGQVNHPGRQVQYRLNPNALSASDVQLEPKMGMTFGKPHAATIEEITGVVKGFAHAAEYLEKAGFDGIELHAGHGFLLSQFLSRTTNKRIDEYGPQTVESRMRIISDIAQAIKPRVSTRFILGAKLNSVEFQDGGITPDEVREVCETLERLGFDYVELSGGTNEKMGMTWEKESTRKREGFFLQWAEMIIKSLSSDRKMKTYISGGMRSAGAMVNALKVVDGVALGRPAAAEPDLPSKIIEGSVQGAVKPVEAYENDLPKTLAVAKVQISQIGRGYQPLNAGDIGLMGILEADLKLWYQSAVQDDDKVEYIPSAKFSGPQELYKPSVSESVPVRLNIPTQWYKEAYLTGSLCQKHIRNGIARLLSGITRKKDCSNIGVIGKRQVIRTSGRSDNNHVITLLSNTLNDAVAVIVQIQELSADNLSSPAIQQKKTTSIRASPGP